MAKLRTRTVLGANGGEAGQLLDELFRSFDADSDGKLARDEFLSTMAALRRVRIIGLDSMPDASALYDLLARCRSSAVGSSAVGSSAVGSSAVGSSAVGSSAVGSSAVGSSAVGSSAVGSSAVGSSAVGSSTVYIHDLRAALDYSRFARGKRGLNVNTFGLLLNDTRGQSGAAELSQPVVRALFRTADKDGNGAISLEEYISLQAIPNSDPARPDPARPDPARPDPVGSPARLLSPHPLLVGSFLRHTGVLS